MNTLEHRGQPLEQSTIAERIAGARQRLMAGGLSAEAAGLDAEVLARHVLGWDRARLLADGRGPAPDDFAAPYASAIERRLKREPVALITGHREFWNLDFLVTPATLVPRPETEMIVEQALRILPPESTETILDIGTGTGCLAIALAHERSAIQVVATDISHASLRVARANAIRHRVAHRIHFVATDLAAGLSRRADLIVSNPPYVPQASALPPDVMRFEPATALFGGRDGLAVIRRLMNGAPEHLAPGGRIIVEFGFGQEDDVRSIAAAAGWTVEHMLHDLQGIARTIVLRR